MPLVVPADAGEPLDAALVEWGMRSFAWSASRPTSESEKAVDPQANTSAPGLSDVDAARPTWRAHQ